MPARLLRRRPLRRHHVHGTPRHHNIPFGITRPRAEDPSAIRIVRRKAADNLARERQIE